MAEEYKSVAGTLSSTSLTTVLTATAGAKFVIRSIYVGNIDAAVDSAISVAVLKSGDTSERYIIKTALVPIQTSFQTLTEPLVLEAGDALQLKAEDVDVLDYVASYLKVT